MFAQAKLVGDHSKTGEFRWHDPLRGRSFSFLEGGILVMDYFLISMTRPEESFLGCIEGATNPAVVLKQTLDRRNDQDLHTNHDGIRSHSLFLYIVANGSDT